MVWICEFQADGERAIWCYVFGKRGQALSQGKHLETLGYKRKQVLKTTGTQDERIKQFETKPEKYSLLPNEYQIIKQDCYYYGA